MVAGGNLAAHVRPFDKALEPAQYLLPSFGQVLDAAIANIETIVRAVGRSFPEAAVVCHGYDYMVPNDGKWLGKPMATRGITDKALQKAIAHEMVDRLNTRLRSASPRQTARLTYVDCRGAVGDGRWHDELHPTDEGYGDVTARIGAQVKRLTATRGAAPATPATRGVPAATAVLRAKRRARRPTPPAAAASAKGISLHVGLNSVDPASTRAGTAPSPPASSTPTTCRRWRKPSATRPGSSSPRTPPARR